MQQGKRARTRLLDLRALASPLSHPRVGLVVPKYHYSAVSRNRVKRQIRELIRIHVLPIAGPLDLVVRAREKAYVASFPDLQGDMIALLARLTRDSHGL